MDYEQGDVLMEFTCHRNDLIEAVHNIHRFTMNRTTLNILEGFHLECLENTVVLFANNLETAIKYEMTAHVEVQGKCVINGRLFFDIIQKLREDIIKIELIDPHQLIITCGHTHLTIGTLDVEQYPLVDVNIGEKVCSLDTEDYTKLVQGVLFGVNTTHQHLKKGVRFVFKDNEVIATTFDGSRVCIRKQSLKIEKKVSITIEEKALKEILQILRKESGKMVVDYQENHIIFNINKITIMTRLIKDKGLDYNQLIYKDNLTEVITDPKNLLSVIVTASSLLNNEVKKSPIILDIESNRIQVSCKTVYGNMEDYMDIKALGDPVRIGFNHRYILDVLKACETELIKIRLRNSSTHIIITPAETDEFCYIIAPVVIPPR